MVAIRTRTGIRDTFGGMTMKLMDSLPKGYCRYDVVADAYKDRSIKYAEPKYPSISQSFLQMGQIKNDSSM